MDIFSDDNFKWVIKLTEAIQGTQITWIISSSLTKSDSKLKYLVTFSNWDVGSETQWPQITDKLSLSLIIKPSIETNYSKYHFDCG